MATKECDCLPVRQEDAGQIRKQSRIKSLPGCGPQGTLVGLLLFLVLINDVGFEGQLNNAGDLATSKRNMKTLMRFT